MGQALTRVKRLVKQLNFRQVRRNKRACLHNSLSSLNIDVLLHFLKYLTDTRDLYNFCLVSRLCYAVGTPLLYRRVHFAAPWTCMEDALDAGLLGPNSCTRWTPSDDVSTTRLCKTLSARPDLAKHARVLEITFHPRTTVCSDLGYFWPLPDSVLTPLRSVNSVQRLQLSVSQFIPVEFARLTACDFGCTEVDIRIPGICHQLHRLSFLKTEKNVRALTVHSNAGPYFLPLNPRFYPWFWLADDPSNLPLLRSLRGSSNLAAVTPGRPVRSFDATLGGRSGLARSPDCFDRLEITFRKWFLSNLARSTGPLQHLRIALYQFNWNVILEIVEYLPALTLLSVNLAHISSFLEFTKEIGRNNTLARAPRLRPSLLREFYVAYSKGRCFRDGSLSMPLLEQMGTTFPELGQFTLFIDAPPIDPSLGALTDFYFQRTSTDYDNSMTQGWKRVWEDVRVIGSSSGGEITSHEVASIPRMYVD